jgi:hypothetical protein
MADPTSAPEDDPMHEMDCGVAGGFPHRASDHASPIDGGPTPVRLTARHDPTFEARRHDGSLASFDALNCWLGNKLIVWSDYGGLNLARDEGVDNPDLLSAGEWCVLIDGSRIRFYDDDELRQTYRFA